MMQFYAKSIRSGFPELTSAVLRIDGVTATGNVCIWTAHYSDIASKLTVRQSTVDRLPTRLVFCHKVQRAALE